MFIITITVRLNFNNMKIYILNETYVLYKSFNRSSLAMTSK